MVYFAPLFSRVDALVSPTGRRIPIRNKQYLNYCFTILRDIKWDTHISAKNRL